MKYHKVIRIKFNGNIIQINFDKVRFNTKGIDIYLKDSFSSSLYIENVFTLTYDSTEIVYDDKMVYFNLNIKDSIFI